MSEQIDLLEKLYAKGILYKIPRNPKKGVEQVEVKIRQVCLDDVGKFDIKQDLSPTEQAKKMKELFAYFLFTTEEQISKIALDVLMEIMDVLVESMGATGMTPKKINELKAKVKGSNG